MSKNEKTYRVREIFVPGGMPNLTYVQRREENLESELNDVIDTPNKLITVTGPTKSGKSVLVKRVLPPDIADNIWIDGGTVENERDFWEQICEHLDAYTDTTAGNRATDNVEFSASGGGELHLPLVGKVGAKSSGATGSGSEQSTSRSRSTNPRVIAIKALRSTKCSIIVDDFHYIDREIQGRIVRALKPVIFDGLPVILIAIRHRRYDAIRVEREMTGRLENIEVPLWSPEELALIPKQGFPYLNVELEKRTMNEFSKESYGSPHLMQEFCQKICKNYDIKETQARRKKLSKTSNKIYSEIAKTSGRTIYERLAQGPRQRSDRKQRRLKDGRTADIYESCLIALADIAPGLDKVEYETIRSAMRNIVEAGDMPQAHEITRVIEKMTEIAHQDETSPPVLDWDAERRVLHITDPYFTFFLKWGVDADESG